MILEMHDVHVNLGLSHVLQGVNLSIHRGETVGLFGRNGVGKTTIVKTIAGWHRPYQGKILFQGQPIDTLPPNEITRLGLGLVPEDRRVFPGLSVEGNLKLGLRQVQASERKAAEERIQMVYERFPRLSERRDQSGNTLSGSYVTDSIASVVGTLNVQLTLRSQTSTGNLTRLVLPETVFISKITGIAIFSKLSKVIIAPFVKSALS